VYLGAIALSSFACVTRAARRRDDRFAWALIGAALLIWFAGDLYEMLAHGSSEEPLQPSFADAINVSIFLCAFAGLGVLMHERSTGWAAATNALIAFLGAASLWSLLVLENALEGSQLSGAALGATVAYPILELALLAAILAVFGLNARRLSPQWMLLSAGVALVTVADSIYLDEVAHGTYVEWTPLDWLWPISAVLIGSAAWVDRGRAGTEAAAARTDVALGAVLAAGAALVAIAVLVWDHFNQGTDVTIALGGATLIVALAQAVSIYRKRTKAELAARREEGRVREAMAAAVRAHETRAEAEHRARQQEGRVVEALAVAVDARDHYTHHHSERVASYSRQIALRLGHDQARIQLIEIAGRLHDVGKIAVPDSILLKRGRLTPSEFEVIKRHSVEGERIVRNIGFSEIALWIRHHHERWDGRGYPDGVRAEAIPFESRILAAADAFDAMTNDRAYQPAIGREEAIVEIQSNIGTQFDPAVALALVSILSLELDYADEVAPATNGKPPPAAANGDTPAGSNGHARRTSRAR
jgi:HD domain-containing protein